MCCVLQCGGKLQQSFSGSAVDVFSKTLRGLAATKLTKPSAFRTADGVGYAVRCSYKVQRPNTFLCSSDWQWIMDGRKRTPVCALCSHVAYPFTRTAVLPCNTCHGCCVSTSCSCRLCLRHLYIALRCTACHLDAFYTSVNAGYAMHAARRGVHQQCSCHTYVFTYECALSACCCLQSNSNGHFPCK